VSSSFRVELCLHQSSGLSPFGILSALQTVWLLHNHPLSDERASLSARHLNTITAVASSLA
jgi:hypothetical protein